MRVVLDTSVLVAALRSRRDASHELLRRIREGDLEMVSTVPLFLEYEEVLKRQHDELGLRASEIDSIVDALAELSIGVSVGRSGRPRLRDPDDEHLLDAALAGAAAAIVTHNVRDLRLATRYGIGVVTPRRLLEELR